MWARPANLFVAALNLWGCASGTSAPRADEGAIASTSDSVDGSVGSARAPAQPPSPPTKEPEPQPDASVSPPRVEEVSVPHDRAVHVLHGKKDDRRVLVYLPGRCGDDLAFRSFANAAVRHGTLVALIGDERCKDGSRFKWGVAIDRIDIRIQSAIAAVSGTRETPLEPASAVVVGYSEGASRAVALARRYPDRYRRVILAGLPKEPAPGSLGRARAVAIVAGERDRRSYLEDAAKTLEKAHVPVAFFLLPGAKHGEYGPAGERVMDDALSWVEAQP